MEKISILIADDHKLIRETWSFILNNDARFIVVAECGDSEQAVEMANNTRFGLAATLVTGDPDRAERLSAKINAGTVWVNCFFVRDLGAPFGGNGETGIGREGGIYSFDFYCDIKTTVFSPKGWTTND